MLDTPKTTCRTSQQVNLGPGLRIHPNSLPRPLYTNPTETSLSLHTLKTVDGPKYPLATKPLSTTLLSLAPPKPNPTKVSHPLPPPNEL